MCRMETNFTPSPKRFKVWDKDQKVFLTTHDDDGTEYGVLDFRDVSELIDWAGEDNIVVIQSTGLKDKNGVEIFEGDIISAHCGDLTGVVKRHESGEWRIYWDNIEDGASAVYQGDYSHLEIIGNIFENKELLEDK